MRGVMYLALLALIAVASADQISRLSVIQPSNLVDLIRKHNQQMQGSNYVEEDGNIVESELANFGTVYYGTQIRGIMHVSKPYDACNKTDVTRQSGDEFSSRIPFLLVERGGSCGFVDKVYNAQEIGAQIVVIVDNITERGSVVMVDNGHGKNVHITSVFISKAYGQIIKDFTDKNSSQTVMLSLELFQKKQEKSQVRFWIDLASPLSKDMMRSFAKTRKSIMQNAFTTEPVFSITQRDKISSSDTDCEIVQNQQFCAPDPDLHQNPNQPANKNNVGTGQHIIDEVIRQICIHKQNENLWYSYYEVFGNECSHAPYYYDSCGKELLKSITGLNMNTFEECTSSSEQKSKILKNQASINSQYKIFEWPAVTVNELLYRGNLDGPKIGDAICNSLKSIDNECLYLIDPKAVAKDNNQHQDQPSSSIVWTLFLILIGFIILFFIMTYAYKKIVKREISQDMNQQVNQMVSQYIAFYESRGKGTGDSTDL